MERSGKSTMNDRTWSILCARQLALVNEIACQEFQAGWKSLGLSEQKLPERTAISQNIERKTGWRLINAENAYLGRDEWFAHIVKRHFPVTDYLRGPEELEFTPMPDLFHEYFGHLAFIADPDCAALIQTFGRLYRSASTDLHQLEIQRLWWFSLEFGFIMEGDKERILGAGLLSSPGELRHSLSVAAEHRPFELEEVVAAPLATHGFHPRYFVLQGLHHLEEVMIHFAQTRNLKVSF